jgi:hypothetical protein
MNSLSFRLSPLIEEILKEEISLGNNIVESSNGWPERESTFILLEKPFRKRYEISNLEYLNLNDPHYWKEEYTDLKYKQTLACRF